MPSPPALDVAVAVLALTGFTALFVAGALLVARRRPLHAVAG
jgi:hypothetical protein